MELTPTFILNLALLIVPPVALVLVCLLYTSPLFCRNPGKNCSGHSTGASCPGSNDSGCRDQIRPPDAGIIKRYFRVPALQAVAGGASCLKMLPVSAES